MVREVTTSGERRTKAIRQSKLRKKKLAREQKLKAQLDSWVGEPLRSAITSQAQTVSDVNRLLHVKETDLWNELRSVSDRLSQLEANLPKFIAKEVASASSAGVKENEKAIAKLERQCTDNAREIAFFRTHVSKDQEKNEYDLKKLQERMAERLGSLESDVKEFAHSKVLIDNLVLDFDRFIAGENHREGYTKRLQFLIKDIEGRMWPWRPNMDRSHSPPPCEDRLISWHYTNQADEVPKWMPWPSFGQGEKDPETISSQPSTAPTTARQTPAPSARPTPPTSARPTPTPSARPTPPSSRPSSAPRYRGRDTRDTGLIVQGSTASPQAPSNSTAAKTRIRPASAGSVRPASVGVVRPASAGSIRSAR